MSETWIVGINPVEGALANDPSRVRELLVEQGAHNPRVAELVNEAKRLGVRVRCWTSAPSVVRVGRPRAP